MPTKHTAVEPSDESHGSAPDVTQSRKARILIIDDEIGATRLLKLNLEGTGRYAVRTENIAEAAMAAAVAFDPDLIFLDVIMPGLDGGQIAALLQSDARTTATPIVFLTGVATKDDIQKNGGAIGGMAFLAKPAGLTAVLACLDENLTVPLRANRP